MSIEITATAKGVATIYDKEVLLYIASLMVAKLEAGIDVSQEFYFTAHDLFRITGVSGSARSYSRLSDALERLQGTQIKTNIEAGGEGQAGFFSWLSEAQLHYSKTKTGVKRLKAVKVRLREHPHRAGPPGHATTPRRPGAAAPRHLRLGETTASQRSRHP